MQNYEFLMMGYLLRLNEQGVQNKAIRTFDVSSLSDNDYQKYHGNYDDKDSNH